MNVVSPVVSKRQTNSTKLPPAKPRLEDSVLFEQANDSGLLVTLDPTSDGDHQQCQGIGVLMTEDSSFHCQPSVDASNPKRPGAPVLSSFVFLDTTGAGRPETNQVRGAPRSAEQGVPVLCQNSALLK